ATPSSVSPDPANRADESSLPRVIDWIGLRGWELNPVRVWISKITGDLRLAAGEVFEP
ncbi:MAG: hypothetical protein ACI8UP_002984, partial [Porticoccaceae bacterium]